ncbi:hypothetical protein F4677DRAFT_444964 [Hypoxylon crocopeplum]|nr:hypothetical protein F4677DRAFT_444964 [Hypoxylon crocopeplum]
MDSERLKQLEKAEEELQRRRERGKLAQRAFRKRQSKASRDKRDETQKLKAAIEEIVRAAGHNDHPELLRAIREAAETAGLDAQPLLVNDSGGDTEDSTIARTSPPLPEPRDLVSVSGNSPLRTTDTPQEMAIPNIQTECWLNDRAQTPPETGVALGWMSPRLDYGLWFDTCRFVRTEEPPQDIVPYLGKGKNTFAGRLFWTCVDYLLKLCRKAESYERTNPRLAKEVKEKIWSMIQHSPPLHNVRYILALAEARLEFRDRGYIEGDNPAGDSDSAKLLFGHVIADYTSRGEDTTVWLSPIEVECELRRRLSHSSFSHLEHALQLWDTNQGKGPLAEVVEPLIQRLVCNSICFGDGPRWRIDHVSAILNGNIKETSV